MDIAERFAANLARYRKAAGLTQEELSVRAEIHRTQAGLIEQGKRTPRLDTLIKLAGALSIPPSDLLEGISFEPSEPSKAGKFKVTKPKK